MLIRASFLFTTLSILVLTSGCGPIQTLEVEVVTSQVAPIRLGILPSDEPDRLIAKLAPLQRYLETATGRRFELVVSATYDALGDLVSQRKIEMAWFSGVSYMRSRARHPSIPMVRIVRYGKTTYRGVIVARIDSGIRKVSDLAGRTFAYVDRNSGSGFLAANQIMKDAQIRPLRDLASVRFTYSHAASLDGVRNHLFEAAALYEGTVSDKDDDLIVVATSGPIRSDVIVASPDLGRSLLDMIQGALVSMNSNDFGKRCLTELRPFDPVDGFIEFDRDEEPR